MKENDDTKNKYDQYDIQKLTPTFNKFIYFLLGCKNLIYIRIFNQFMMIHGFFCLRTALLHIHLPH